MQFKGNKDLNRGENKVLTNIYRYNLLNLSRSSNIFLIKSNKLR